MRARTLARVVIAAALVAVLAGCADWGINTGGSGKTVTLTYALWDAHEQIGYQASINEFEKLHPDIRVNIDNVPYNSYEQKITAEYITNQAPDLFWVNTPWLGTFVKDGILTNIAPKIKASHIDMSQYYPQLVALHSRNGAIYGLPKDWDTIALYYNKAYFKKIGLTVPANLSWSANGTGSFVTFLKKATTDTSGHNALSPQFNPGKVATYALGTDNDPQSGYGSFVAELGGKIIPHPYAPATSLTTPAFEQGMSFLTSTLTNDHVIVPGNASGPNADGDNLFTLFTQGKIAMWQAGDWNTTEVKGAVSFPVGVTTLPSGPDGRVSVFNGLIDGLNTHTKYPKQAWELEQWLGSAQSQKILGSGGYVWPAIKSLDPLFQQYWQKNGIDMSAFLTEAHGKVVNFPVSSGMGAALQQIQNDLGPAWLGQKSVSSALKQAGNDANYALKTGN
ncbi:MAG TPA: sugar ABC transporter substrate-binding protein [Streptosporangiaceae bacterium]|nr:sugar ABC transporter substrate-binding protein [Streptosporangiaceae bacterium]